MRVLATLIAVFCAGVLAGTAWAEPVTVFAASSLRTALDALAPGFEADTGTPLVLSYAGTSALARQIEQGAPADVFVAAHPAWIGYLEARGAVDGTTLAEFASNRLVLIAAPGLVFDAPPDLASATDILAILGEDGRIAVALTQAVPAGLYARQALEALGSWDALAPRLAETDNVRAALHLVARGEAVLGIVYATDALVEPDVAVVARIDPALHAPIIYSAVRVARSENPVAERFLDHLRSPQAQAVLRAQGFLPAP